MSLLAILFWFCGQRFQLLWAKQDSIGTATRHRCTMTLAGCHPLAPHKLRKSRWNELWCMNMYDVYWLLLSQHEFNFVQFDEFDEDGQLLTAKQLLPATFFSLACTLLRALKLRASWGSAYAWRLSRFFIPFSVVSHTTISYNFHKPARQLRKLLVFSSTEKTSCHKHH